jgi:preprotein translocase subunit YajC
MNSLIRDQSVAAECPGFGHGRASPGGPSAWVQLMPFVLVVGIFYFVILLPMKRRQQKVQAFLGALKVGDRIVTSGGLYGTITRLSDQSVQVQVADKVRVEMSRNAVVGYQGQEPVAPESQP